MLQIVTTRLSEKEDAVILNTRNLHLDDDDSDIQNIIGGKPVRF
jgi:hypothetical protein